MKELLTKFAATGSSINQVGNATDQGTKLTDAVPAIINGIIGALALIAVVVVIIGGIGYMTSSGDAGKVKKAKDTILYGLIGLAICALAFAIVNWVITGVLGNQ